MSFISRIFGGWRNIHYAQGIAHFNRREFSEAIAEFQQLLDEVKDPSSPDVELARFYSAEAHTRLGLDSFREGDFSRAQHEFLQAVAVEGSFPDLYYYLGVLAFREQRAQDSLAFLDRALELNPHYIEALACRVLVQERLGHAAAANSDLARLASSSVPIPDVVPFQKRPHIHAHVLEDLRKPACPDLARAMAHYDSGALQHSLAAIEEAIVLSPGYADLRWRYGQILSELNRREEAVAAFDDALAINPDFIEVLLARGLCLLLQHRPEDAEKNLEHAAGLRPRYADVAYYQGIAAMRTGRRSDAAAAMTRALEINPRFCRARFVMGQIHLTVGDRDLGLSEIETALEERPSLCPERPGFPGGYPDRAACAGAVEYLSGALAVHPDYPDLHLQLGMAYLDERRVSPARSEFREAVRLNPEYVEAHCHLGKTEFVAERPEEAIPHLSRALDLDSGLADVHCLLGEAHLAGGDVSGAAAAFDRALSLNPRYVDALLGLAALRRDQSRDGEAEKLYRKAREITRELEAVPDTGGVVGVGE